MNLIYWGRQSYTSETLDWKNNHDSLQQYKVTQETNRVIFKKHLLHWNTWHTLSAPEIMLLTSGIILLLLVISYPKKYFAWDKAITMAEAVVKPEITEWLMNRISHPSLDGEKIKCKLYLNKICWKRELGNKK